MKKTIKLFRYTFSEKVTALICLAGLILTMIPIYRLSYYSIPYYDDYGAAAGNVAWAKQFGTSYLTGAVVHARQMWWAWEGTYFARVMMALDPVIWGEKYHFIGIVMIITSLLFSVFVFIYIICRKLLRAAKWDSVSSAAIVCEISVLFIYTAQQGFYWYNSGVKYILGFSIWLLSICASVMTLVSKKLYENIIYGILSAALIFCAAGSNFVTVLQSLIVSVSIFAAGLYFCKKRALFLIPSLIADFYGAKLCLLAPGNTKRASAYEGMGAFDAIIASFKTGFEFFDKFLDWRTLLLFLIALPVSYRIVRMSGITFKIRIFIMLAAWSVCLYASGFTPNLYSSGEVVLSRVINVIKLVFQLLLWINMTYFLGLLSQIKTNGRKKWKGYVIWPAAVIWLTAWIFFFRIQPNPIGTYSAFGADFYLKSGQAELFHEEYTQRLDLLHSGDSDIVFKPYTNMPWFLGWTDISSDPDSEANRFMADFYHKSSIKVEEDAGD